VRSLPDGKLRLKLEVAIDRELLHWILSFGPRARAIGPERLVGALRELIEETRQAYATEPRPGVGSRSGS
jgi:predicted DNA-binding transcriptional regulator YafY